MGKDVTAFRERFNAYKNGKSVSEIYDAGLPRYAGGKPGLTKAQLNALDELYEWGSANGLDITAISGIGGNGIQESSLDSEAVSKSGYAGLWQNNKNLQAAIIDRYGDHSKKSLLAYAKAWINGEDWVRKGKYAAHTAMGSGKFKKSGYKTAEEASDAWMKQYERPVILDANGKIIGYLEQGKRRTYSKLAYDYLNNKYGRPILKPVAQTPITAAPDAVAVRPTIPELQTVPVYDTTVSPYISGKPMVRLSPRIKLPNLMQLIEDSEWEPPFEYKNGKLPEYGGGKIGHNVSNAKLNNDGTFTDDYTKVFEDMYVTPQKADLKLGSYTLNNFPYYLQHRTDWMKPFMSSGTNEKGLELIYPEFDLLLGGRQLATELIPAKIRPITKLYDNAWDRHYFKALSENDLKGAQNLREAHFRVNAYDTKVKDPQYHTVGDEYDPNWNVFDKNIEHGDASFYTSSNPYVSGTYSKEITSEAERDYIIEQVRKMRLASMGDKAASRLKNSLYWEAIDPKKFRKHLLEDHKWIANPVNPSRLKKVYLNIKNPFVIDANGRHWSLFDFNEFPKDIQSVIRARGVNIYNPWSTRSIEEAYPKAGYDSAIIKNVVDMGGSKLYVPYPIKSTVIETADPKNIKYFDTITYDDTKNIIPLSKRDDFDISDLRYKNGKLPGYKNGKIHIKPANRGKFTALKKRTGHSASWFKENGTPAQKKMAVFALNSKKWKH